MLAYAQMAWFVFSIKPLLATDSLTCVSGITFAHAQKLHYGVHSSNWDTDYVAMESSAQMACFGCMKPHFQTVT